MSTKLIDEIDAAAAAGRAEREAVKAAERERLSEIARQHTEAARKAALVDDAWVRDELPAVVRAATAKGERVNLYDGQAAACKRAGLTVESEWVEPWNDDGCRFGGYYHHWLVV